MDNSYNSKMNLEYGCKLIYETINIPVFFLDRNNEIQLEYPLNFEHNPIYQSKLEFFNQYRQSGSSNLIPLIKTTNLLESLVLIPIREDNLYLGTIILGPTTFPSPTIASLDEMIRNLKLEKIKEEFSEYYSSLAIINNWKMVHASMLLYHIIYNQQLDIKDILKENKSLEKKALDDLESNKNIFEKRLNFSFHHDPLSEKKVYQYITEGRQDELLVYYKSFRENSDFEYGVLSKKSDLRSQKNLSIAAITLATRASISGGLHPEIAYTLGDTYIQELEELNTVNDVVVFKENVLYEFANRVNKSNQQQYSKPISTCQNYIFQHLYEKITLTKLAEHVSLNSKYLSNLFKKEVGVPISVYIQQIKIEEAKKLMTFTDYSFSEIHALLNFTDQSYFTKVFKNFTHMTPKEYKSRSLNSDE